MGASNEYCNSCIWSKIKKLNKGTILRVLLKDRDITLILEKIKHNCLQGISIVYQ
jgi:hypothetical protein